MNRLVSTPAALLVAIAAVGAGCSSARPAPRVRDVTRSCYAGVGGLPVNSTLVSVKVNGGEQLLGLTELGSGERVVEEATIDASGRLVDGKQTVTGLAVAGEQAPVTSVAFEPAQDTITMTTRELSLDWRVQSDLPWVWLPLLAAGRDAATGTPAPIAT